MTRPRLICTAEYCGRIGSREGLSRDRVLWENDAARVGFHRLDEAPSGLKYVLRGDQQVERTICSSGNCNQEVELKLVDVFPPMGIVMLKELMTGEEVEL